MYLFLSFASSGCFFNNASQPTPQSKNSNEGTAVSRSELNCFVAVVAVDVVVLLLAVVVVAVVVVVVVAVVVAVVVLVR